MSDLNVDVYILNGVCDAFYGEKRYDRATIAERVIDSLPEITDYLEAEEVIKQYDATYSKCARDSYSWEMYAPWDWVDAKIAYANLLIQCAYQEGLDRLLDVLAENADIVNEELATIAQSAAPWFTQYTRIKKMIEKLGGGF